MKDVLQTLNLEVGVKGSLVVTRDGLVVHQEVGPPLNAEVVGPVASDAIKSINAAIKQAGSKEFTKFVFTSTFGKMVFHETGEAYLVVVLDKAINLEMTMLAITSAANKIKKISVE
ncbi:MAG: roadblock/LC7 domain-containing protein [Planctomycetes bacterium]|nr:roadblock/LC7 domain-containing protein [Planctomycetota bacterium]